MCEDLPDEDGKKGPVLIHILVMCLCVAEDQFGKPKHPTCSTHDTADGHAGEATPVGNVLASGKWEKEDPWEEYATPEDKHAIYCVVPNVHARGPISIWHTCCNTWHGGHNNHDEEGHDWEGGQDPVACSVIFRPDLSPVRGE